MPRTTIQDVARAAGVSKGAASHALNGKPGVSDITRARVVEVAQQLGWQPDFAARALSRSSVGSFGLAVARTADTLGTESFFMSLLAGMEEALAARDMGLLFQLVEDIDAECRLLERWAGQRRVDGVLLLDPRVGDPRIATLERLGIPAAVISAQVQSPAIATLVCDEGARMDLVLDHLEDQGIRRALYLGGDARFLHVVDRGRRFLGSCEQRGILAELSHGDYSEGHALRVVRECAARIEEEGTLGPTALIADNDLLAARVLRELGAHGLGVPGDVVVVALEDSLLCEVTVPQITSLRRDVAAQGRQAVELLSAAVDGRIEVRAASGGELRVRESSRLPQRPVREGDTGPTRVPTSVPSS